MPSEIGDGAEYTSENTSAIELKKRRKISTWLPGSISWSTQFNDLRTQKKLGNSSRAQQDALLRELKIFGLFEEKLVIRDADVVNSLPLLNLITDENSSVRSGIVDGVYTLGLRTGASSFSEVNHTAGKHRAYPKRYLKTQPQVEVLDSFLKNRSILIAEIDSIGRGIFASHLDRLSKSELLNNEQVEYLIEAIKHSKNFDEPELRFGRVYQYLREMRKRPNVSHALLKVLLQWCRSAHVLAVPSDLGLAVTSSDNDLNPTHVSFILNGSTSEPSTPVLKDHIFPKNILSNLFVERMGIKDMLKYRQIGFKVGYFAAAADLQRARGSSLEAARYEYLRRLEEYMIAIAADNKAELIPIEKELAQRKVDLREYFELFTATAIPVVIGGVSLITTHSPISPAASLAVSAGVSALNLGRYIYRQKHKVPLKRLLEGSTHTAPQSRPHKK